MANPKRFLRLRAVRDRVALGHDSIYRGAREGWFPKPVRLSANAVAWLESEIDEWIDKRVAEREKVA